MYIWIILLHVVWCCCCCCCTVFFHSFYCDAVPSILSKICHATIWKRNNKWIWWKQLENQSQSVIAKCTRIFECFKNPNVSLTFDAIKSLASFDVSGLPWANAKIVGRLWMNLLDSFCCCCCCYWCVCLLVLYGIVCVG